MLQEYEKYLEKGAKIANLNTVTIKTKTIKGIQI